MLPEKFVQIAQKKEGPARGQKIAGRISQPSYGTKKTARGFRIRTAAQKFPKLSSSFTLSFSKFLYQFY